MLKKWKCKDGHITESENKPEKCSHEGCEIVEFEEVVEQETTLENKIDKVSEKYENKRVENLEKKVDTLLEELKLEREAREKAEKEKIQAVLDIEKKYASEERKKEIEIEEEKQKELEERANTLKIAKEKDAEANEWKTKYEAEQFKAFKLKTSIEKPWLETMLNKCETKEKYEIMLEIIDESDLKAKYESEKNGEGSILNAVTGKSAEKANKPKTVSEILAENIKQKEQKILDKRRRY